MVALTHAESFDKKSKLRFLHDVMPQGRREGGMHLKVTSIFRANSQSSHIKRWEGGSSLRIHLALMREIRNTLKFWLVDPKQ